MGIDAQALNFLRYARRRKAFGRTITLGRQELQVGEAVVRRALGGGVDHRLERYCDSLLLALCGATSVDALDHSAFEGASVIHDLNAELPLVLRGRFDTVIDAGCVEHVYNVPQALKTCSQLLASGGQVLHIAPANNFCGHGFWQFSPELFFSLYAARNGYRETEVFLGTPANANRWFKVAPPIGGSRVNVYSSEPLYVLVRAVIDAGPISHDGVQQSDYAHAWERAAVNGDEVSGIARLKRMVKRSRAVSALLAPFYRRRLRVASLGITLHPALTAVDVRTLL